MKAKWNLFRICLLGAAMLPAVAEAQFTFTTNDDNTITITGYTGPGGAVTIPGTTNGYPVTSIGDNVFYKCYSLTNVTIPNSVITIGSVAFTYCTNLTNVTLPNGITTIGDFAFFYCSRLTSVPFPNSVTDIGYSAFGACNSLTSVTIGTNVANIGDSAFASCARLTAITVNALNPFYSSVAGVLFNHDQSVLIQCPGGKAGGYTISNSVITIGDGAFGDCYSLTNVTIPNSVTSIGSGAFSYCTNLTSVAIPQRRHHHRGLRIRCLQQPDLDNGGYEQSVIQQCGWSLVRQEPDRAH
jgi:hypothetical protein